MSSHSGPTPRPTPLAPLLAVSLLLLACAGLPPDASTSAAERGAADETADEVPSFRSLQFVLLMAVPERPELPEAEVQRIQKEHRGHLRRMGAEGRMLVAGPFGDQSDPSFRGLCLYDVGSVEEARRLAESDPAVLAGRLRVDVMSWWFEAEALAFPMAERLALERAAAAAGG